MTFILSLLANISYNIKVGEPNLDMYIILVANIASWTKRERMHKHKF